MNNDFYFDKESENNEGNNTPPLFYENGTQSNDVEIDFSEFEQNENTQTENTQTENAVENNSNVLTEGNPFNTAQNPPPNQTFQPNYYGYQQSYQPIFENTEAAMLYHEKKAVKRTSNHIGVGLILFFALQFVISYVLAFFMINKNTAAFISDSGINLELNILLSFLGFGLAAFFILKTEGKRASELISYAAPQKGSFVPSVMVGVGFCYTANIIVSMLQTKFESILPFAQPEIELPNGILGFLLSVLSVAVAPALIEEFLFRGVIMGSLLKFGKPFAIFASAFLFGLVHGNLIQIPFAFLVGLVIGVMVIETNSFWTGVIIHFANNFISVCMDYLGRVLNENLLNVIYLFLLAALIIVGFFGYYVLSIKNKDLFVFKKPKHLSTSVQKFGWFSASAGMIIYFVIIFLEVLLVQVTA